MRFAYSVKQKIRVAMLLFAVMVCSILIRMLEDKSVEDMNESFVSMYNDRLIPATDLFYISEHVQQKRSLIEEELYAIKGGERGIDIPKEMAGYDAAIDSLMSKYEKTLLVRQEKDQLRELKRRLLQSEQLESSTVRLISEKQGEAARRLFESSGRQASKQAVAQLSVLMRTQKMVGQELLKDSEFMVSGSKLYSTLQVALAILIGVLIVGIVFTSNLVKISNENFHLN